MRKAILLFLVVLSVTGCNRSEVTRLQQENAALKDKVAKLEKELHPAIPKPFKANLRKLIEDGFKVTSNSNRGISYNTMNEMLVQARASFDLCASSWPKAVNEKAKNDFERAIDAWGLALDLWGLKINDSDTPTAPDINGYQKYISFGEKELMIDVRGNDYIVRQYRGKKYLPFENINILLGIGSQSFNSGNSLVQEIVQSE